MMMMAPFQTMFSELEASLRTERTWDLSLVKNTLTHPRIWPFISDDSSPPPDEFCPIDGNALYYAAVYRLEEFLGLFVFSYQTGICWEGHTALLPNARGPLSRAAVRAAVRHIWENTEARRLVTTIPIYNRLAMKLAKDCGWRSYGYNPRSIMVGGRMWDQELFGISREAAEREG